MRPAQLPGRGCGRSGHVCRRDPVDDLLGGRARGEHPWRRPSSSSSGMSASGMIPPPNTTMSAASALAQQLDHLGEQGQVRARQHRQPDRVGVLLDRGLDDLLRRLVQAGVDDLDAGVAQRAGHHLGAAVVAVEPGLGDDDAHRSGDSVSARSAAYRSEPKGLDRRFRAACNGDRGSARAREASRGMRLGRACGTRRDGARPSAPARVSPRGAVARVAAPSARPWRPPGARRTSRCTRWGLARGGGPAGGGAVSPGSRPAARCSAAWSSATSRPPGTPILLVHGMVDNRSIFTLLRRGLRRRGFGRVLALNYSPLTDDVREVRQVGWPARREVCAETGYERIHVVGHSMGGLVARYYVQRLGGDARVHTLVTLGTPHGGTQPRTCFPAPAGAPAAAGQRRRGRAGRARPPAVPGSWRSGPTSTRW